MKATIPKDTKSGALLEGTTRGYGSKRLLARTANPPPVTYDAIQRSVSFGDYVTDVSVDGVRLRCHGGRDGERIVVEDPSGRHGARNVIALAEGLAASLAVHRREPSLTEILSVWPEFRSALRSEWLRAFEERVEEAAVAQFSN